MTKALGVSTQPSNFKIPQYLAPKEELSYFAINGQELSRFLSSGNTPLGTEGESVYDENGASIRVYSYEPETGETDRALVSETKLSGEDSSTFETTTYPEYHPELTINHNDRCGDISISIVEKLPSGVENILGIDEEGQTVYTQRNITVNNPFAASGEVTTSEIAYFHEGVPFKKDELTVSEDKKHLILTETVPGKKPVISQCGLEEGSDCTEI